MDEEELAEQQYEDQLEEQTIIGEEAREDFSDASAYAPYQQDKGDMNSLFKHVIDRWDVTKTANLDPKTELGMTNISFRGAKNIALIARMLGEQEVWEFFSRQAQQVIAAPSLSKDGHLLDVFITQKRIATRQKGRLADPNLQTLRPKQKEKWTLFKRRQPQQQQQG